MRRLLPLLGLMAAACGEPRPATLAYGLDGCDQCHMTLAEPRYAAQLVTTTRKVYRFDDPGCLVQFLAAGQVADDRIHSVWVNDFLDPDRMLRAEDAVFLRSDSLRTPMDHRIAALTPGPAADSLRAALDGELLTWAEVRAGSPAVGAAAEPGFSLVEAIRAAAPGGRVVVPPGRYEEGPIVIDRPLELVGVGRPEIRGRGDHVVILVTADSVTLRGLVVSRVLPNPVQDRAAVRFQGVRACVAEDLEVREAYFGIYGADVRDCRFERNVVRGPGGREERSGNAIHLWSARDILLRGNLVTGHRDGFYFEFVKGAVVEDNVSEGNIRYGLHFMFSDSSAYRGNRFERNGAGVAVMYTTRIVIERNRFAHNTGPTAYGLLLKDIGQSRIADNVFETNTVALLAEGGGQLEVRGNRFLNNGWAVRVMANSTGNRFEGNVFAGNSFDVATNSRSSPSVFHGNWWDRYTGYDLVGDGRGDVPFRPVRLFAYLVMQNRPAMILLRSLFVNVLDAAERVLPVLTPETLVDASPLMEPPR
jgi:nitrous oxidase accessory protein